MEPSPKPFQKVGTITAIPPQGHFSLEPSRSSHYTTRICRELSQRPGLSEREHACPRNLKTDPFATGGVCRSRPASLIPCNPHEDCQWHDCSDDPERSTWLVKGPICNRYSSPAHKRRQFACSSISISISASIHRPHHYRQRLNHFSYSSPFRFCDSNRHFS